MPTTVRPESALVAQVRDDAPRIAGACLQLLDDPRWIRRRTERATFYEYETLRVSSTLDVVIPNDVIDLLELDRSEPAAPAPQGAGAGGRTRRLVLPLDVLAKDRLRQFDLTLDGKSISLLSSREIAVVTAWMLAIVAAKEDEVAAPLELLERVSDANHGESVLAYEELEQTRGGSPKLLEQALKYRDNYLLLAEMTIEGPHAIVKYARDEALNAKLSWDDRLGLSLPVLAVPLGSIAICGSYHVEAVVPSELKIWGAQLQSGTEDELRRRAGTVLDHHDDICDRASLYVRSPPPEPKGALIIGVATHRWLFLAPAALIAGAATLGLLVGGLLAVLGVLGDTVGGSAGSAVFLAPSLAAGLVLYRTEAPLVRVMLGRARAVLALTTALAFVAGGALALGARDVALGATWLSLALMGAAGTVILGVSAAQAIREVPNKSTRTSS